MSKLLQQKRLIQDMTKEEQDALTLAEIRARYVDADSRLKELLFRK